MAQRATLEMGRAGKAAVLICSVLSGFATAGLIPILPAITAAFADVPNAPVLVRALASIVGIGMLLGAPLAGAIADRIGRRRVLLTVLMLYGLAGTAGFIINDIYVLMITRFIVGACGAASASLALAIIADAAETVRNRWIGYFNVLMGVGGLVMVPSSGFLGRIGWHYSFLLHGLAFVVFALAVVGLRGEDKTAQAAAKAAATRPAFPGRMFLVALAAGILMTTYLLFVPFHFNDLGTTDPRLIAVATMPSSVLAMVTSLSYGTVRARLSMNAVFAIAFLLFAMGHAVISLAPGYFVVVCGLSMLGFGSGLLASNTYALGAITGPNAHRAFTMGLCKGTITMGQFAGQMAMEPVMKRSDAATVIAMLGGFALMLSLLYAKLSLPRKTPVAAAE
jgi:MFS family permease